MIEVKRLHELTRGQIKGFAAFLKEAIHTQKTEWVCQACLQPDSWGDNYLDRIQQQATSSLASLHTDRWIGLIDGEFAGVSCVSRGIPDRTITLFAVNESLPNQLEVADTIALFALSDILSDKFGQRNIVCYCPNGSPAAAYAKLCGFKEVERGPLLSKWEMGVKELYESILARQK